MHDTEHEDRHGRRILSFSCIELCRVKNFFQSVFIIMHLDSMYHSLVFLWGSSSIL